MTIRFAVWAAVSSKKQAEGWNKDDGDLETKDSLPEQEKRCRAAAIAKGWRESAGPFVVPGESRTRWVNLRDAEDAIPALRDMLDAAKAGEFDVLVLYDYSRLRELLDPVARTLAAYGVQLYSINQPVDPQSPESFDAYATDTANAVQTVNTLTSRAEINALRRRYRIGVPGRVRKGLHTVGLLPYGYRKPPGRETDPDVVPVIDPEKAALVLQIKDRFLLGQSAPQLAAWLNEIGVRSPRGRQWHPNTVRKILRHPFYAGVVQHGTSRRTRDPRTGGYKDTTVTDRSKIMENIGRHEPLWDPATHRAILDEFRRRHRRYKGRLTSRLSRLLYCAEHDRPLSIIYYHHTDDAHRAWYCRSVANKWHLHIRDSAAIAAVSDRLTEDLQAVGEIRLPEPEDRRVRLAAALEDLRSRRDRLTDALEDGALDPGAYSERVRGLEARISGIQADIDQAERSHESRAQRAAALAGLAGIIERVPEYIQHAPATEVNAQLHMLIEKIAVDEQGKIEIFYR